VRKCSLDAPSISFTPRRSREKCKKLDDRSSASPVFRLQIKKEDEPYRASLETIERDAERDRIMGALQTKEYGNIDQVIKHRK
jgi:Clp protease